MFHVPIMDNQIKHLGHPLLSKQQRSEAYSFINDKFHMKLGLWKANKLSHAGRLTLIKPVIPSIPIYYMSTVLLLKKFFRKLIAIIRTFWWIVTKENQDNKPLHLRAWKDVCKPKSMGGLGIRDLEAMNEVLVIGSIWRILTNQVSTISKVYKAKYFPNTSYWRVQDGGSKSWAWNSMLKVEPYLIKACKWQFSKGDISIWF